MKKASESILMFLAYYAYGIFQTIMDMFFHKNSLISGERMN